VALIVEEAGGRCSTFEGEPPGPGRSFLSSGAALHAAAVTALTPARRPGSSGREHGGSSAGP
jgi:hypothetical protein